MLLLHTTTYHAHDFVEAARSSGVETVVGSEKRQALESMQPGRTVTIDLDSPARAAAQIARFARSQPLDAIVPTDDRTAIVAAMASEMLGLRHNPPGAALTALNKNKLREILLRAGVATPRYHLERATEDPAVAASRAAYPCVLKPTFLAASRGVIRADTPEEFRAAFTRIGRILKLPEVEVKDREAAGMILVEEFIPGVEVALEGLLSRGRLKVLALFDKPDPLDGPFFEETIYVTPSRLTPASQRRIVATASDAAAAIGLVEGPVHAELRLNDSGVRVIEMAARSIGGLCSRALRFGTGFSLEELIVRHAVGRDVSRVRRERAAAGVMMIPVPCAGVLREVHGLREARSVAGVADITISATPGASIVPLPEGSSYLGFIFARGRAPAAVERSLRAAHAHLRIVIE